MGILNCTPDSFSDGVPYEAEEEAVRHGLCLLDEGADILDIGAESTRPGARPIAPATEQARLLPVLERLRQLRPDALLSVDTYHATTAGAALAHGADIVNDVSGLRWDRGMGEALTAAGGRPGLVLMHARGTPPTWKDLPALVPGEVSRLVVEELEEQLALAAAVGIAAEQIVVDPGFGFGKRGGENFALLADLATLHRLQRPILIGLSRKGFLAAKEVALADQEASARSLERQHATTAAQTAAVLAGAHILRVHEVEAALAAASVGDRLQRMAGGAGE